MKILLEVPLSISDPIFSTFSWLNNNNNQLFVIEDGKRMRTLSIDPIEPGKELHSVSLAETKTCTSSSWNMNGSILALIIDRRQIYIWETEKNSFVQFKPTNYMNNSGKRQLKLKDIDGVVWSKFSNNMALAYSTGQILLCNYESSLFERFIDNSEGVLGRVNCLQSCQHLDLLICISDMCEILIMTFDGESKFYFKSEFSSRIVSASLSPCFSESFQPIKNDPEISNNSFWLAYLTSNDALNLKLICGDENLQFSDSMTDLIYRDETGLKLGDLVSFHWLNSDYLIACYSSGFMCLLRLKYDISDGQQSKATCEKVFQEELTGDFVDQQSDENEHKHNQIFKSFIVRLHNPGSFEFGVSRNQQTISLSAISNYQLFYYELSEDPSLNQWFTFDKVDHIDLSSSLRKLELELKEVDWSYDCSMMAVQLSNGHILVYRSRLQNHMVSSYLSKIAFLSEPSEVTVLNYEPIFDPVDELASQAEHKRGNEDNNRNAITVQLDFRPSAIAIGLEHLATVLNNRVRFYNIGLSERRSDIGSIVGQLEYISIVISLKLNSKFAAVQFNDGRLKLHTLQSALYRSNMEDASNLSSSTNDKMDNEERFFPNPMEPKIISAYTLTEELLIYAIQGCSIYLFSLRAWLTVMVCDHSLIFDRPIMKLRANFKGNKLVCLVEQNLSVKGEHQNNVFLYDLYTNSMLKIGGTGLYGRIFENQIDVNLIHCKHEIDLSFENKMTALEGLSVPPRMSHVMEAVWDSDGRIVLLIEPKRFHIYSVLDHTLEREGPRAFYVGTTRKSTNQTLLFASQGVVSFQTALGRVNNSIMESHDDEQRLLQLGEQIGQIKQEFKENDSSVIALIRIMNLKLKYLTSILPIYSLSKCKDICFHLMEDEMFNLDGTSRERKQTDLIMWKQLAAWAAFTMHLDHALLIYRKQGLSMNARALSQIIESANKLGQDTKISVRAKILVLLNCRDDGLNDRD